MYHKQTPYNGGQTTHSPAQSSLSRSNANVRCRCCSSKPLTGTAQATSQSTVAPEGEYDHAMVASPQCSVVTLPAEPELDTPNCTFLPYKAPQRFMPSNPNQGPVPAPGLKFSPVPFGRWVRLISLPRSNLPCGLVRVSEGPKKDIRIRRSIFDTRLSNNTNSIR